MNSNNNNASYTSSLLNKIKHTFTNNSDEHTALTSTSTVNAPIMICCYCKRRIPLLIFNNHNEMDVNVVCKCNKGKVSHVMNISKYIEYINKDDIKYCNIINEDKECSTHDKKYNEYYCLQCEVCICFSCMNSSVGHKNDICERYDTYLKEKVQKLEEHVKDVKSLMQLLNNENDVNVIKLLMLVDIVINTVNVMIKLSLGANANVIKNINEILMCIKKKHAYIQKVVDVHLSIQKAMHNNNVKQREIHNNNKKYSLYKVKYLSQNNKVKLTPYPHTLISNDHYYIIKNIFSLNKTTHYYLTINAYNTLLFININTFIQEFSLPLKHSNCIIKTYPQYIIIIYNHKTVHIHNVITFQQYNNTSSLTEYISPTYIHNMWISSTTSSSPYAIIDALTNLLIVSFPKCDTVYFTVSIYENTILKSFNNVNDTYITLNHSATILRLVKYDHISSSVDDNAYELKINETIFHGFIMNDNKHIEDNNVLLSVCSSETNNNYVYWIVVKYNCLIKRARVIIEDNIIPFMYVFDNIVMFTYVNKHKYMLINLKDKYNIHCNHRFLFNLY
jgi:hypothetical protein